MGARTSWLLAAGALALVLCCWTLLASEPSGEVATGEAHGSPAETAPARVDLRPVAVETLPETARDLPAPAAAATQSAREAVERPAVPSSYFRGRLVDRRTGEGLENVFVRMRCSDGQVDSSDTTDAKGRFASTYAYAPTTLLLNARCKLSGKVLDKFTANHNPGADGAATGEFLWPVEVGPTLYLELDGGPGLTSWKTRIVERDDSGERREWPWIEIKRHGEELMARYHRVVRRPDSAWTPEVEVSHDEGVWKGSARLAGTVGLQDVRVRLRAALASVVGRVTDTAGEPVPAVLSILRRSTSGAADPGWTGTSNDDGGRFELHGLTPGSVSLFCATDTHGTRRLDLELHAGVALEQDVVFAARRIAGDVRGVLVGPAEGRPPFAMVRLRSLDDDSTDLFVWSGFNLWGPSEESGRSPFELENLAAGRYRLSVHPFDGRAYEPASQVVTPPAEDVVFTTHTAAPVGEEPRFEFVATDASSGAPIEGVVLLLRFLDFWSGAVTDEWPEESMFGGETSIPFSMVVGAPGYRPCLLRLSDAREVDGLLRLEAALQPGHGAAIVVLDGERAMGGTQGSPNDLLPMYGLAGARILVDGREVGRSDETGLALCVTDAPIDGYEVQAPGWARLTTLRFENHRDIPDGIGLVLMTRD